MCVCYLPVISLNPDQMKKKRSKWSKASSLFVAEVVLFLGALHIFAFPSNPVTPKPEKKEWALQMSAEGW